MHPGVGTPGSCLPSLLEGGSHSLLCGKGPVRFLLPGLTKRVYCV